MIALDAMGGDHAPTVTVHGALNAAKQGIPVCLYGDEARIVPLLDQADPAWRSSPLSLVHCSQTISMGEEPSRSVLKKKDASLVCAMQAVADGTATAVISAGNSGAALVAGTLLLGRSEGVLRPALGNFIPTKNGSLFCIDLGATTDAKVDYLEQYALMGHLYVRNHRNIPNPRVALLSNGAEPYKGSQLVKDAYDRLMQLPINFVGNLEARYIFDDHADVLVTDGFSGNVMLKAIQGTAKTVTTWLKQEVARLPWYRRLLFSAGKPAFNRLSTTIGYADKPGALLLGLAHPLIIAHGCANALAIERAIIWAQQMALRQEVELFNAELADLFQASKVTVHGKEQGSQPEL